MTGERVFSLEELAKFNGTRGKPAYFAYRGKVYDVTGSDTWENGDHLGAHQAGSDLTEAMAGLRMARKCLTPSHRSAF